MSWHRTLSTLVLLLLAQCSGEACSCHYEARGPSTNLELRTREPPKGLPKDKQEDACDRGKAEACQNLAVNYEIGSGVTKNLTRAAELYELACRGGLNAACGYSPRPHHSHDSFVATASLDFNFARCDRGTPRHEIGCETVAQVLARRRSQRRDVVSAFPGPFRIERMSKSVVSYRSSP
jgi:hypothetical protein